MIILASPALPLQVSDYIFMCSLLIHKLLYYHSMPFHNVTQVCTQIISFFFSLSQSHIQPPCSPPPLVCLPFEVSKGAPATHTHSSLSLINYA